MVSNVKSSRGFTLIEVMIVVVIVAILAAIALPSYQQYVERSRRVDATETLLRMAALQERFFFQESNYSMDLDDLGGDLSPEGWYDITIDTTTTGCDENSCSRFIITATPVDPGPQANDTQCSSFTINQTLQQTAQTADGSDADNCW